MQTPFQTYKSRIIKPKLSKISYKPSDTAKSFFSRSPFFKTFLSIIAIQLKKQYFYHLYKLGYVYTKDYTPDI
jgi:hypothetical protein